MRFNKLKNFLLDLFFPKKCLGCSKDGIYICQNCLDKIEINKTNLCPFCQKIMPNGLVCQKCKERYSLDRLIWATPYSNPLIKDLIRIFKYHYIKELASPLSQLLTKSLKDNLELEITCPPKPRRRRGNWEFLIVPIPLYKKRLRFRGFNQAELLAKEVAEYFSIPLETNVLKRKKFTIPQAKIKDYKTRRENIKDIFEIHPEFSKKCINKNENLLKDKFIILIDDVSTTGATLSEAAKVLKRAGTKEVWGLVIAKG